MTLRLQIPVVLVLLAAATLHAQTEPQPPASTANDVAFPVAHAKPKPHVPRPEPPLFNFDMIVLDPAHGGSDNGAKITDNALEKDVNLAFALRLQSMLGARGFMAVMTRKYDITAPKAQPDAAAPQPPAAAGITPDQRVEVANRMRPVACILIHSTNGGHGVHLFTSSLTALSAMPLDPDQPKPIVPWDTAQAASIPNSLLLANDLSTALNQIRIPLVVGRASVSPIDSMACPAIAIELAPLAGEDGETPASDEGYQRRVAEAVTSALVNWRGHAESISMAAQAARAPATPAAPTAAPPVKKPRPKLVTPPVEVPDEPGPTQQPAPIVRKPPATPPPPGAAR